MPVRLDPFKNIVGVNWGGLLSPVCSLAIVPEYSLGDEPEWIAVFQIVAPEESPLIGGTVAGEGSIDYLPYYFGQDFVLISKLDRIGFDDDGREPSYRSFTVRPQAVTGGTSPVVDIRIFLRSTSEELPSVAAVIGIFGFGRELVRGNDTIVEKRPEGLIWEYFDFNDPLPNEFTTRAIRADRENRFEFWGNRAFNREIPGAPALVGTVADFGTLRLNFQRGTAEMLPPDTSPPPST